jgi:hypothetical protein
MNRTLGTFLAVGAFVVAGVSCSDDVGLPDARPPTDAAVPGQLMVSWTISHMGAAVTCAEIAGSSVTVEIVPAGAVFGVVDSFSCGSATGTSRLLAPGDYDLELSLEGSGGTLGGPTRRLAVRVTTGGVAVVDPVAFDVDPHGDLAFNITTPGTGSDNCGAMPGGAGITAVRLELRDVGGTCVPTMFAIAAGATTGLPAGSYNSDCATASFSCIGSDQQVTAQDIRSGQRSMVLTGLVGANACWRRTSSFVARAAGFTTTLNAQQLIRDTVLCPVN